MRETLDRVLSEVAEELPESSFALRLWDGSVYTYGSDGGGASAGNGESASGNGGSASSGNGGPVGGNGHTRAGATGGHAAAGAAGTADDAAPEPAGASDAAAAEPDFTVVIREESALVDVLTRGTLGFGEAYMRGGIDVEGDLQAFLRFNYERPVQRVFLQSRDGLRFLRSYLRTRNDLKRARKNVQHHYDLGNDFYRMWLDGSLTYSCAYWRNDCTSLEEAQTAKYDHICRKLHLEPGDRLVDIGCGWGGMLLHAATEYGVRGVGYTLSEEQHRLARRRFEDAGVSDRVDVRLQDYREAEGEFDKFVSIGMFEHVGKEYYEEFFEKVQDLLVPGGLGVLHTIAKDHEGEVDGWVRTYIFPGGYLPTLAQIAAPMNELDLVINDVENLRLHYAATLDEWARRFEECAPAVRDEQGAQFVRMWRLYLNGSSAAFKWGGNRVYQVAFSNGLRQDLPLTRDHLYC